MAKLYRSSRKKRVVQNVLVQRKRKKNKREIKREVRERERERRKKEEGEETGPLKQRVYNERVRGEAATLTCVNHMRNIHNYLTMSFRWTVRNIAWTLAATEPANRTLVSPICAYNKDRSRSRRVQRNSEKRRKTRIKIKETKERKKSVETTLYKLNGGSPLPPPFTLFSFISVYEMNKYMFIFFHICRAYLSASAYSRFVISAQTRQQRELVRSV